MAYAISVFFDSPTDSAVRELWQTVEDAGISSFLTQGAFHPHLTLAVYERVDVERAREALRELAESQSPLPVALPSIGTFPGSEGVVFLAATMTETLLRLHREVYARMAGFAEGPVPYYLPDQWNPHCSVARALDLSQIPLTVGLCQSQLSDTIAGWTTQIGLIETPQEIELCRYDFLR